MIAYRRHDWARTARQAEERLRLARDDDEAVRLLARASARLGRFSQAKGLYARLSSGWLEAEDHHLLGLSLVRSGQFDAGQKEWRSALSADPDRPETLESLAQLAFDRGQLAEGAEAARRLTRQPGWEVRGDLLLGMIEASDHNPTAASLALSRALTRDPQARLVAAEPQSTRKLLARTLLQAARPEEAREILQPCLADGSDREIFWLLSRVDLAQGKSTEAAAAFARSGSYRAEHPIEPEPSPYLGAARCELCHRPEYQAVLASRHGRTLPRGPELASLPMPQQEIPDPADSRVTHVLRRGDDQVTLETRVDDRVYRAVADYALGATDRYSTLVGRDDLGRTRTLRLSFHGGKNGQGWHLTKNLAEHPQRPDDFLGELLSAAEGAGECLSCHTTSVRSFREQTGPEASDRGIGCERCHGPGANHTAAISMSVKFPDPAIAAQAHTSPGAVDRLCAQCHSQHFLAMPASRSDPLWARFPSSTLYWSRCYSESGGALHCTTCHDPHRDAETSADDYVARCLTCHASYPASSSSHPAEGTQASRTACPISPAKDCLRCHMPKVPYRQMHIEFTDHYIRTSR
jgi:tetratricopeptide (TPR) repeat protein